MATRRPVHLRSPRDPTSTPASPHATRGGALEGEVLSCGLNGVVTVEEVRERLAQVEAVEAHNARAAAQRMDVLRRGWARLLRVHSHAQVTDPHPQQLRRLATTAQALVEGEAAVCDVLREVEVHLAQWLHASGIVEPLPLRRVHDHAGLVDSMHGAATPSEASPAEGDEGKAVGAHDASAAGASALRGVVNAVVCRAQQVARRMRELQDAAAEQARAAQQRERALAADVDALEAELGDAQAELALTREEEQREQERLAELHARRTALECDAALRQAVARREAATRAAAARVQQLLEEAAARDAVAREELKRSEAHLRAARAAHDAAVQESRAVQEALRVAQQQSRVAAQRCTDATADLADARRTVSALQAKCDELRAQRRQVAADTAEVEEALRGRRRPVTEWGTGAAAGASSFTERSRSAAECDASAAPAPQELAEMQRLVRAVAAEVAAREARAAALDAELQQERRTAAELYRQKVALEARLTCTATTSQATA